jgi:hypothetical protein
LLDCVDHFLRFGHSESQRLFAKNVFTGLGRRDRHFAVKLLWKRYVDDVDVVTLYNIMPICFDMLPTPSLGEFAEGLLIAAASDFEHWLAFDIEKSSGLEPGVRMSLAHEFIANNRYP